MSTGLITSQHVALVRGDAKGMDIESHDSELAVIMDLMNSGRIGDGCYGSNAHLDALEKIEIRIGAVRSMIKSHNDGQESEPR